MDTADFWFIVALSVVPFVLELMVLAVYLWVLD